MRSRPSRPFYQPIWGWFSHDHQNRSHWRWFLDVKKGFWFSDHTISPRWSWGANQLTRPRCAFCPAVFLCNGSVVVAQRGHARHSHRQPMRLFSVRKFGARDLMPKAPYAEVEFSTLQFWCVKRLRSVTRASICCSVRGIEHRQRFNRSSQFLSDYFYRSSSTRFIHHQHHRHLPPSSLQLPSHRKMDPGAGCQVEQAKLSHFGDGSTCRTSMISLHPIIKILESINCIQ